MYVLSYKRDQFCLLIWATRLKRILYTGETDGISLLFPGLNTADLSKAYPNQNNIASTHEFHTSEHTDNVDRSLLTKKLWLSITAQVSMFWPF